MLTRWNDPFRDLTTFQRQMNRLFGDVFGSQYVPGAQDSTLAGVIVPPVDIKETPEKLIFHADLPGFRTNDLTLRVENGVLTLEGERKFEDEANEKSYHRVERSYGRFIRTFSLPTNVDPEKISASMTDGVLTVELQKREEAKPKAIPIQGSSAKQIGSTKH